MYSCGKLDSRRYGQAYQWSQTSDSGERHIGPDLAEGSRECRLLACPWVSGRSDGAGGAGGTGGTGGGVGGAGRVLSLDEGGTGDEVPAMEESCMALAWTAESGGGSRGVVDAAGRSTTFRRGSGMPCCLVGDAGTGTAPLVLFRNANWPSSARHHETSTQSEATVARSEVSSSAWS